MAGLGQTPAFILLRFFERPANLTGVAQVRAAGEALALIGQWHAQYPEQETLVFDLANRPVSVETLARIAAHRQGAAGS